MPDPTRTTRLLQRVEAGDDAAADELLPLVYDELRQLAERQMGNEPAAHTLQPTALVHEAWLRMVDDLGASPGGRRQFFAFAARVMRNVLVDHARARRADKRGGKHVRRPLEQAVVLYEDSVHDLVELDEALARLAEFDEQLVRIVELRFFAGLSAREAAEVLDVPLRSLERGWATARAWLRGSMIER
ncbi:MAG: extracytoplasmic sigma factor ECF [Planctomycetota bacterium]|nr:MAG: extracytoplasmic sigma factor ECF [Planctomycetota bacterium]